MQKKRDDRPLYRLVATLFTLVFIIHGWRVINDLPLTLGMWYVPVWLSIAAALLGAWLAITFWKKT